MRLRCSVQNLCLGMHFCLSNTRGLIDKPFQCDPYSAALYIWCGLSIFSYTNFCNSLWNLLAAASLALCLPPCIEISQVPCHCLHLVTHPIQTLNFPSNPRVSWKKFAVCAHMWPENVSSAHFWLNYLRRATSTSSYEDFCTLWLEDPTPLSQSLTCSFNLIL